MAKKTSTPKRRRKTPKTVKVAKRNTREIVRKRIVLPQAGDTADVLGVPTKIRGSYHRYLHAHVSLVDQGKSPTLANLAKELHISATAVWKFQKRHPDILAWIGSFIEKGHEHYASMVVRRVGNLAIQGSAQHADIFLKYQSGAYVRAGAPGDPDAPAADGRVVVNNTFLVPRPDYAGAAAQAALPATTQVVAIPASVPRVNVR